VRTEKLHESTPHGGPNYREPYRNLWHLTDGLHKTSTNKANCRFQTIQQGCTNLLIANNSANIYIHYSKTTPPQCNCNATTQIISKMKKEVGKASLKNENGGRHCLFFSVWFYVSMAHVANVRWWFTHILTSRCSILCSAACSKKKKLYPHRRQCLMLADIVTRFPGSLKSHLVAVHSDEINTGKI